MALGAAAIAGIASAVGTAASSIGSTIYGTERNIWNSNDQARINRDFQKEMASTEYQRAVQDMEAAGLNPAAIGAGMSPNSAMSGTAATGNYGYSHAADFSNIFSTAVKAAMSRDKNVSDKILQEMKDETALQVQHARNEGMIQNEIQKKELGHASYRTMNSAKHNYDISSGAYNAPKFEKG